MDPVCILAKPKLYKEYYNKWLYDLLWLHACNIFQYKSHNYLLKFQSPQKEISICEMLVTLLVMHNLNYIICFNC